MRFKYPNFEYREILFKHRYIRYICKERERIENECLNNATLGCAKSIALPRKVINLSSSRVRFHFFHPSLRKKKKRERERLRASLNQLLRASGRRRGSLVVFLSFFSRFFFSPSALSRHNESGSIDGWGMILCNEGCGIFMPERAGASPRGAYRRDTRVRGVACRYHRGCSLCIAGG